MASPPTTYAELKEEIADYGIRTDVTSAYAPIVGWIKYVESEINRKLRLREQEQRSTADYTVAAASRFLSVPTDMIEMLDVRIKKASERPAMGMILFFVVFHFGTSCELRMI